jgi:hypothetical protein
LSLDVGDRFPKRYADFVCNVRLQFLVGNQRLERFGMASAQVIGKSRVPG